MRAIDGDLRKINRECLGPRVAYEAPKAQTASPVKFGECKYFGELLRTLQCTTCRGSVKTKVFQCHKFGECAYNSVMSGVKRCDTCSFAEKKD